MPHLAVVPIDGDRLEPEAPSVDVDLLDLVDGGRFRRVDRLGNRAGQKGLNRRHHLEVAAGRDDVVAHGAREDRHVVGGDMRRSEDRMVGVDVTADVGDLTLVVPQAPQCALDGLVHDRHRSAADELLGLDQPEVGLDARRVGVHHERDGPGRGEHARLSVAYATLGRQVRHGVPHRDGIGGEVALHRVDPQIVRRLPMQAVRPAGPT